jgi:hypothetical protein
MLVKRKVMVPREYQKSIINFTYDNNRCGVWAGMGME